jgi:hypothetical protein
VSDEQLEFTPTQVRLVYSLRDFELALSALQFLAELDEKQTYRRAELRRFRCYLDTATVSYCRPFTRANGMPRLGLSDFRVEPDEAERGLHERVLAYRHQVVAHSDPDRMRMLVSSIQPFDDLAVRLPVMRFEEGLEFVPERRLWEALIRKLMEAPAHLVFARAQEGKSSFRIERG